MGYDFSVVLKETNEAGGLKFRPDGKTLSFSRDDALGLEIHCGNLDEGNVVSFLHHPSCTSTTCQHPFVKNDDCSLSPRDAPHLVLGWATVDFRCGQASTPYTGFTLVPAGSADRVVVEGIKYMFAQLPAYTLHCVFVHIIVLISSFRLCRSVCQARQALLPVSQRH